MGKESLTAYRIVYDGPLHAPKLPEPNKAESQSCEEEQAGMLDVSRIPVTKKMLEACRGARKRYDSYLDEEKKKKMTNANELRKKSVQQELTALRANKRKLELTADVLLKEADDLAQEAEKKRKMDLLAKSNAFRDKAKGKRKEIEESSKQIETLEKKLTEM